MKRRRTISLYRPFQKKALSETPEKRGETGQESGDIPIFFQRGLSVAPEKRRETGKCTPDSAESGIEVLTTILFSAILDIDKYRYIKDKNRYG